MKPALKYGLICGMVSVLWTLLMFVTGLNRHSMGQYIQMLSLIYLIAFMVMAVSDYRKTEGNGFITLGQAFGQAYKVGLISSVISMCFYYIYLLYIDPSFVEYQMQLQVDKMSAQGLSEESIEAALKQIGKFMTPGMQFVFGIVIAQVLNAIVALIVAAVKKYPNPEILD